MANPQADQFTKLSNELFEAIMQSDFSKRQRNIIDLIIRMSYGCGKKVALLRPSDFEVVGVLRTHVKKELNLLSTSNVLIIEGECVQLNKNYDQWRISLVNRFDKEKYVGILSKNLSHRVIKTIAHEHKDGYQNGNSSYQNSNTTVTKTVTPSYQNGNSTVTKTVTDTPLETSDDKASEPRKESIKESIKENIKDINNNNESPNSWLEGLEAEHASNEGNRKLIDEVEGYFRAKRGEDPNKPTTKKNLDLIIIAVGKYSREEIIDGINHAFLTAEEVYSFQYCLDCMETQKQYREKQRQPQQQKKNVVPFNNKQKQSNNKPDSKLPISIRQQMEREERERQGIKEPEPSPEEVAKQRAELKKLFEEMGIHREDLA